MNARRHRIDLVRSNRRRGNPFGGTSDFAVPNWWQAEALARTLRELLNETTAAQRLAFDLGVTAAELETGVPGLFDPEAQVFIREMEYRAIRGVTTRIHHEFGGTLLHAAREGLQEEDIVPLLRDHLNRREFMLRTIARTEMNRAANWGRYSAWKRSGVVQKKEYMATFDDRVRPGHLAADGNTVPLDKPFTAGDAAGFFAPPIAPNCRCTHAPVTDLFDAPPSNEELVREQSRFRQENIRRNGLGRATGLAAAAQPQGRGCPVHSDATGRLGFVAAAVRREIPGLRKVESEHEKALVRIVRKWPALLASRAIPEVTIR